MKGENSQLCRWLYRATLGACAVGIAATSVLTRAVANTSLAPRTQQAMMEAIEDEYYTRAFYRAALAQFGEIRPFTNLLRAEERHVQRWNDLFAQYGLSVPIDSFAGRVTIPDTLQATSQKGVELEIANVQMYDSFLSFVREPDLRTTFAQLRQVSQENHLSALKHHGTHGSGQGHPSRRGTGSGRRCN